VYELSYLVGKKITTFFFGKGRFEKSILKRYRDHYQTLASIIKVFEMFIHRAFKNLFI
jgi:hypothetical protein